MNLFARIAVAGSRMWLIAWSLSIAILLSYQALADVKLNFASLYSFSHNVQNRVGEWSE